MKKKKIIISIFMFITIISAFPTLVLAKYIITKHQDVTIYINTSYNMDTNETIILNE